MAKGLGKGWATGGRRHDKGWATKERRQGKGWATGGRRHDKGWAVKERQRSPKHEEIPSDKRLRTARNRSLSSEPGCLANLVSSFLRMLVPLTIIPAGYITAFILQKIPESVHLSTSTWLFLIFGIFICIIILFSLTLLWLNWLIVGRTVKRYSFNSNVPQALRLNSLEAQSKPAYELSPSELEHEVAWLFERLWEMKGNKVRTEVFGSAGDGGIDIKVFDDTGTLIAIVQVKRFKPDIMVAPIYLRDLDSVKRRLGVRSAYLVTTGKFSQETQNLADQWNIKLIDGDQLAYLRIQALSNSTPRLASDLS